MLKESFVDFLSSGRGLAVIHAGVASFRQWPEFGEIVGARFDNHPWGAGSTVTLRVDEPDHPVTAAFKEPYFIVTDEIYQVKAPYSRDKVRVLLSVDPDRTRITPQQREAIHREDMDFAMTWVKRYGKGRVFYCALGHEHPLFWNPVVLQHYLDGIQFVLGDLAGDATPRADGR
jgi:type 1 glutamine amidotransferase